MALAALLGSLLDWLPPAALLGSVTVTPLAAAVWAHLDGRRR